jgi:hypothetical protein
MNIFVLWINVDLDKEVYDEQLNILPWCRVSSFN